MEKPELLFLSERWLVVSKPAGWLTIPGRSHASSPPVLLAWATLEHGPVWVVHRLDRETSGVVLMARSSQDHRQANLWFQSRKIRKVYHCLAMGDPSLPLFKIQQAIEGAPSCTQVEVKERFKGGFLAQVLPLTGRRHQIRIHLSAQGHPIFGDTQYGGIPGCTLGSVELGFSRVALHSSSLTLPTGEGFSAPFPSDFQEWLHLMRKAKLP